MTGKAYLIFFLLGGLLLLVRPLIPLQHQLLVSFRNFLLPAAAVAWFWGAIALGLRKHRDRLVDLFSFWFLAATFAGTLLLGFLALWQARLNLSSPLFLIDHVERTLYLQALDIFRTGRLPYPPPDRLPLIFDAYNPLFQCLLATLFMVSSPNPVTAKVLAVSFSALLVIGLSLSLRKLRINLPGRALAVFTFFSASPLIYLVWARNDSMLAFLIAGFLWRLYRSRRLRHYLLCLPWLYLAFLTKQTGLLWAGLIPLVLVYRRVGWRNLLMICSGGLILLAGTVYLLNLETSGNYLFWTVTLPARHPMKPPPAVITSILAFVPFRLLPVALALAGLALLRSPRRAGRFLSRLGTGQETPLVFFGGAAVYGVLLGLIPLAKTGGLDNGFLPVLFPLSLSAGLLGQSLLQGKGRGSPATFPVTTFTVLSLTVLFALVESGGQAVAASRAIRQRAAAADRDRLASVSAALRDRGISRVFFPPAAEPGPGKGRTSGLQEHFAPSFGYYLDEAALKDYLAAGFPFPESFHRALGGGEIEAIVVRSGHIPFAGANPYGRWPTARCDPELYPDSTRGMFRRFFRPGECRVKGFDLYEYRPGAEETR